MSERTKKPSVRQLRYLAVLAERCGESFAYPATRAEASAQIKRLERRKPSSPEERRREMAAVRRAMASGR